MNVVCSGIKWTILFTYVNGARNCRILLIADLFIPLTSGMMLQRPRHIAEKMVDEIGAFYGTDRPPRLREIHIVVFKRGMMKDFKMAIQRKYKKLQVAI